MTMPWGSTEEPDALFEMSQSTERPVVSSGARPGKSVGAEFGQWRTVVVSNVVNANSITPGATRLLNRSQRRHRAQVFVQASVAGQPVTDGVILGSSGVINSGLPAVIGSLGGFMPIGQGFRYEVQAELWVCYPASNTDAVYVTVCDEIYASES
jgi:hypothetical protein